MKKIYRKMGLISDRRNKTKQPKNENSGVPKMKKGLFGGSTSHMFPLATPRGIPGVPKYPAGYYTTPVNHSSSWSHPGQPKFSANVNPRYQTWVAPRKQPALGQLVIHWFFLIKYIQEESSDRSTLVPQPSAKSYVPVHSGRGFQAWGDKTVPTNRNARNLGIFLYIQIQSK